MRFSILSTRRLATLGFGLSLIFASAGEAGAQYGTLKGQVIWDGPQIPALEPKVKAGANVKDSQVCAADSIPDESLVIDPETKGIGYCIVYLSRPSGDNPALVTKMIETEPEVLIDQVGCRFIPHVAVLHEKQQALFKSSDPVAHNVRLQGFSNSLNFMLPANGESPRPLASERRPMPMACDIHPWMTGFVMVFDHPFFALTDEQGNFEIEGVPAGKQNIVIWQEKVGYVTAGAARGQEVTVEAGKETTLGPVKITPSQIR